MIKSTAEFVFINLRTNGMVLSQNMLKPERFPTTLGMGVCIQTMHINLLYAALKPFRFHHELTKNTTKGKINNERI